MRNIIWLACGALTLLGCQNSSLSFAGKPEDTVKAFVDAVNKTDGKGALDCLLTDNGDAASAGTFLSQSPMKFDASDYKVEMKEPYLASVSINVHVEAKTMPESPAAPEKVLVLYSGGKWKIVPTAGFPMGMDRMSLGTIVSMLPMTSVFVQARRAAQTTATLSNAKQVALGMIMYASDSDDLFPLSSNTKDAIMPYLKNKELFTAAGDPAGTMSFSFNEQVLGVSNAKIMNMATTVLLYQGKDHHLDFSHDGKAAVAFCDGHVRSVTAGQESTLNWDPSK